MDIVKAKALPKNIGRTVDILVSELNLMYCDLTGKNLTFKGHVCVHYGSFMEQNGPADHVSTIRFESKHRDITKPARVNMSRTDICFSAAVKHQLSFAFKILSNESILPTISFGPMDAIGLHELEAFGSVETRIPKDVFGEGSQWFSCDWVNIKGSKYFPGCILFVNVMECSKPTFGKLEEIICNDQQDVLFIFSYFVNLGFNSHVHAYHVIPTAPVQYSVIRPNDLLEPVPLHVHCMVTGDLYVPLKYNF
jgi:hypothetical protein